jgi:hypothetical protein
MKLRFFLWNSGRWSCPTARQRGHRVIEELQRRGIDAEAWDRREDCDVLVVQRALTEEGAAHFRAQARSAALWLDINDDTLGTHRAHMGFDERALDYFDGITTCSEWLAEKVTRLRSNVHVWPEAIDAPYRGEQAVCRECPAPLRVAWMGGTDNLYWFDHSPVRWAFQDLAAELDLHWVIAAPEYTHDGKPNRAIARALLPGTIEFHRWNYETVAPLMASCDCSIIALEQSEWCWSKSDNKPASMMAMGLPVLVEDVPCYRDLVHHEATGLMAYQADEWAENLRCIATDAALRARLGETGRAWAVALRGVEVVADRLLEVVGA